MPRSRATARTAENADRLLAEAIAHHRAGRPDQAAVLYRHLLAVAPASGDGLHLLGLTAYQAGRLEKAISLFGRALAITPLAALYHGNLGLAQRKQKMVQPAEASFRRAIELRPDYPEALNNLGLLLQEENCPRAAASYVRAMALRPDYAEAFNNLGTLAQDLGRLEQAESLYRRALAVDPGFADAHNNLGMTLLLGGHLAEGWTEYAWRWQAETMRGLRRNFSVPAWAGEDLGGRTILLHAEQGLGDTIQFCRYAPLVAERGARVLLEVDPPLVALLSSLPGIDAVIAKGLTLPSFDFHCPLVSLPRIFGTDLSSIPASVPYLAAEDKRVRLWRRRIGSAGLRVGINWQGDPRSMAERGRSPPLVTWTPLAAQTGVRLISLQKHNGLEQLEHLPAGMAVETLAPDFDAGPDGFLDTAAVMATLDLIVTSDTAIAHLAGALGRPVWVALKAVPHWIWLMDREDSPWYPTMRLFRQQTAGDWSTVFQAMALALKDWP